MANHSVRGIAAIAGVALLAISAVGSDAGVPMNDPYLWLEEITGARALDWVKAQDAITTKTLEATPEYAPIREQMLSILNSKERIPYVNQEGKYLYNFWQDETHVRGLWRRTTLEEYKKPDPAWETVLDLDALAASEKENWVWRDVETLKPEHDRCLVKLSRGGADAVVVREFDLEKKAFVADGFSLPEAKTDISWRDRDTLYVATDFGPGSMTTAGYPRIVKEWHRGTPLKEAKTVFEGKTSDVEVSAWVEHSHGRMYEFIDRGVSFFSDEMLVRQGDAWTPIEKPADSEVRVFGDFILLRLRADWKIGKKTYASGSLLAANFDAYMKDDRDFSTLFIPTERTTLDDISDTKNYLILNELSNVTSVPVLARFENGQWTRTPLEAPANASVNVSGLDADTSDAYFMTVTGYLTPTTLLMGTAGEATRETLKRLPSFFDTTDLQVEQFEAVSKDGTRVPYFQVSRKGLKHDGSNPTLLYGYGGFEISLTPAYHAGVGVGWLSRGGVYVVANIRGGASLDRRGMMPRKEHRQRAYDDFIAVGEDLITRGVTSKKHLGIRGGSNGGLLMGVMLTERPDLWGAVVCDAALLDMRRYSKLLAGASWIDEYGDPDKPEDWAYLSKYSPYQNVKPDVKYPPVLFTSSTRDDRVHPGHCRKMVALMESLGDDVLYYENTEGGHAGSANNEQFARVEALAYSFLWRELR